MLAELEKRIVVGFGSSSLDDETNRASPNTKWGWTGTTSITFDRQPKVAICLAHEILKPLFRNDLSHSERMTEEFFVVNVILHELAVRTCNLYSILLN